MSAYDYKDFLGLVSIPLGMLSDRIGCRKSMPMGLSIYAAGLAAQALAHQPVALAVEMNMERVTIGVVSDTHIPDRARGLHPGLLPALERAGVSQILHAGDIAAPGVLEQLGQVAPVTAVRGNRDWLFKAALPWSRQLEVAGVPLLLTHGHGNWPQYLADKWYFLFQGYRLKRYQSAMARTLKDARVIVFGHTHVPENFWQDGRLWFNPGSAAIALAGGNAPSFGLLHFTPDGQVSGEIIPLDGARLVNRRWV